MTIVPVVLSGGSGTRLWPVSRRQHPKQLLPLVGDSTMLQQTVERAMAAGGMAAPLVVCNAAHADLVAVQLDEIGCPARSIVLEPVGRNTAPAVALAALIACADVPDDEDVLLLVLPADHLVQRVPAFVEALGHGRALAEAGTLVTFGIVPDHPHTGFGYIRAATPGQPSAVEAFVEKPDRETAQGYLDRGGYYWNSGMFLLSARTYLEELRRWRPDIAQACASAVAASSRDGAFVRVCDDSFGRCPSDSIDYAVMEKTERAAVVPLDAGWSDVGSWSALYDVDPHDEHGNDLRGEVVALDCERTLVHAHARVVAAVGLTDVVVVETEDAVLVTPRGRTQDVKAVVAELDARGLAQAAGHRVVRSTWGTEHVLATTREGADASIRTVRVTSGRSTKSRTHARSVRLVVASGNGRLSIEAESPIALAAGDAHRLGPGQAYVLEAGSAALKVVLVEISND